jgi:acetylornithine/succinyldiaminopimelate/putrescine aminotransferase
MVNGDAIFKDRFGDLVPGCSAIPFNDLAALEKALSTRDVAAFIVEPIQGKGVNLLDDIYLRGVQACAESMAPCLWPAKSSRGFAAPDDSSRSNIGA